MKDLCFVLITSLAIISCGDDTNDTRSAQSLTDKPFYPEVEFYLLEQPLSGAISPVIWQVERSGTSFSVGDHDEATNRTINEYSMKTEYLGSDPSKRVDFHSVIVRTPESDSFAIDVSYNGTPSEIWNDDRYTAGIRPLNTKKANKSEMATPRKPSD